MGVCNGQAMETLLGLQARRARGSGFVYSHAPSGYAFELRQAPATASEASDGEDDDTPEAEELEYRPLQLGSASEVGWAGVALSATRAGCGHRRRHKHGNMRFMAQTRHFSDHLICLHADISNMQTC